MKQSLLAATGLAAGAMALVLGVSAEATGPAKEAAKVAEDAYVYGYPLVLMDATQRAMLSASTTKPNEFMHMSSLATASDRTVVRPNADTLYSSAWLDLAQGPVVMHVPATDRYYLMQMLDAFTNVFAAPGPRTTGKAAQDFVIVGPSTSGDLPSGMQVIRAPTELVWVLGRVQVNGAADLASAAKVQQAFSLRPLGAGAQAAAPAASTGSAMGGTDKAHTPPALVAKLDAQTFFARLARLLENNPPAPADKQWIQRFGVIGLVAGKPFAPRAEQRAALETGVNQGRRRVEQAAVTVAKPENGWQIARTNIGRYGTDFDRRAGVALYGLGANLPEDAVYPGTHLDADNQELTGKHSYVMHFNNGSLPPVHAFWSLTLYDQQGYFVGNPLDRHALGDRDKLLYNRDGSLDILIQHEAPGAERKSNWLPAPEGPFSLLMRLYGPKPEVLNGSWTPPPVRKLEAQPRPAASRNP